MGCVTGAGSRAASYDAYSGPTTPTSGSGRRSRWPSTTTPFLRRTSKGGARRPARLRAEIAAQTRAGHAAPGLRRVGGHRCRRPRADGRHRHAPAPATAPDPTGAPSGRVFKVERGAAGEKVAYVRMFTGSVGRRGSDSPSPTAAGARSRASSCSSEGGWVRADAVAAGQIGRLHGLGAVRVGDGFGADASARSAPLPAAHARGVGRPPYVETRGRRCARRSASSPTRTR